MTIPYVAWDLRNCCSAGSVFAALEAVRLPMQPGSKTVHRHQKMWKCFFIYMNIWLKSRLPTSGEYTPGTGIRKRGEPLVP